MAVWYVEKSITITLFTQDLKDTANVRWTAVIDGIKCVCEEDQQSGKSIRLCQGCHPGLEHSTVI
jgi:hypothetical protein